MWIRRHVTLVLPNISSTVCISRTTQSRSELSADLSGVNVEVGWTLFLFISGSRLWKCVYTFLLFTMHSNVLFSLLLYSRRDQKWLVTFNLLSTTPCSRTPLFSIGIGIDFDICPWSYRPVSEPLFWVLIPTPHWPCWSKKRKYNYQKKASSRYAIRSIMFMNYVMEACTCYAI